MKQALLIFAKNPVYGKVKTRLATAIGHDAALSVYRDLLEVTKKISCNLSVNKIIFYSDFIEEQDIWDQKIYEKQVQRGENLGRRMQNAFIHASDEGNEKVIIIGSDCPEINGPIIMSAFAHLNAYDVIIGPATDGGYYLLGMKKLQARLFENISWSTASVLEETIEACKKQNLLYYLLPVLSDLDEEKDLLLLNINS
jgi:rSAM/selenodomain-associated transferase 1